MTKLEPIVREVSLCTNMSEVMQVNKMKALQNGKLTFLLEHVKWYSLLIKP